MAKKLKVPSMVVLKETGAILRLRRISRANPAMLRRGWKGLVCYVQNYRGTGLVEYRKLRAATRAEIDARRSGL